MKKQFLFVSVLVLCHSSLWAQQLRMGPPIVEISTTPASSVTFYLSLVNQTEQDVNCTLLIRSMDITEKGMPFPVAENERSAAPWLKIHNPTDFVLRGKETQRIRCSFTPPLRTESGGYYGMILCRTNTGQQIRENKGKLKTHLNLKFQFACVVMALVKGDKLQANIQPEGPTIFGGNRAGKKGERDWYAEMPVRNDGNIHVVLDGLVQLMSESGQLIQQLGLIAGKGYLFPEQRRTFRAQGKGPLPDGIYVANIRLGQTAVKKFATEKIPFYILDGQVFPGRPAAKESSTLATTSQGFIIDKPKLTLEMPAGGKQIRVFKLTNITNQPVEIESAIKPWDQNSEGDIIFPGSSKHQHELSENILIQPSHFTLQPKQHQTVKVKITVPKTSMGEYFDAIIFHRVGTELSTNAPLLLTQSVLTEIKAKKTEEYASDITEIKARYHENSGTEFTVSAINQGNTAVFPEGRISVFNSKNEKIGETIKFGEDSFILPENTREYVVDWERLLPPDKYRAELTYTFATSEKGIQKLIFYTIK